MPIQIDKILSAGLFTIDGEKVMDLTGAFDFTSIEPEAETEILCPMKIRNDMVYTFTLYGRSKRNANRLGYGWIAKGPIRKKVLWKEWNKRARSKKN